jgi:hypothetical protein
MGEFYAWTATGQVAQLKSWSSPDVNNDSGDKGTESTVFIASKLVEGHRFVLRQRDGKDVDIVLANTEADLRNGEFVTTVWAAREGVGHGHCIFLENHTTGEQTRLPDNVKLIRPKAGLAQAARFGALAASPAAIAMLAWLLAVDNVEPETVVTAGSAAIEVLFLVGFIVSRLVYNFLRSEDEQKLWQVADHALADARNMILSSR